MLELKPYRQMPGNCGPASLKMVAEYFGIRKTEIEMARLCGTTENGATHAQRILDAAKGVGLKGFVKDEASLGDLRQCVEIQRIPAIVDWFSGEDGHYSPVAHVSPEYIYLMDPEIADIRKMLHRTFLNLWFDFMPTAVARRKRADLVLRRMIVIHP